MTGYTAPVVERKQPFNEFVLNCARAFVPQMRDMDGDIPESFPEETGHYSVALVEAKKVVAKLQKMTPVQRVAYGKKKRASAIKSYVKYLTNADKETALFQKMLDKVRAWSAPTEEHAGLKNFMIQQLEDTIKFESSEHTKKALKAVRKATDLSYFKAELKSAMRDIPYYMEKVEAEKTRIAHTNKWIADLRASL